MSGKNTTMSRAKHLGAALLAALVLPGLLAGTSLSGEDAVKHPKNPELADLPEGTAKLISSGHKASPAVLDFSGMVYDPLRHKILTFGGGHATQDFPTSVHEFDLQTLKWTQLTEEVPPEALSAENAVKSADGTALGGVKYKDKIHAGSRHTYGGLVMLPGTSLMAVGTSMEFAGAAGRMPEGGKLYRDNYQGGSGLWIFDPVKREWSVSKKAGLVSNYGSSVCDPQQPDWIYHWGYKSIQMINWKTEETRGLPNMTLGGLGGIAYNPEDRCFYVAPCPVGQPKNTVIMKFDIKAGKWEKLTPAGDAPSTYDTNIVYDEINKVMVCFSQGLAHYYSPKENKWYKLDQQLGKDFDNRPMRHHHVYDPVDNVHIVTSTRWNTYAYKFSDQPGKLPGTSK